MRYADAHTQRQFDQLQRAAGRPADSPGWGKLVACKTGAYVSERNPADHTTIEAGSTHFCRDYWLARERPELFKPADKREARTYREHRANLERARQQLERGTAARQAPPTQGCACTQGCAAARAAVAPTPPGRQHQGKLP